MVQRTRAFRRQSRSSVTGRHQTAPGRWTRSTTTISPWPTKQSANRPAGSASTRCESYAGPTVDNSGHKWLYVAMRRVGVAELKNNLSKNLRLVENGEVIEVTDHDRAIARLIPIEVKTRLVIREPLRPFSEIAHKRYPPLNLPVSSLDLLMEERGQR